jgi:hypothetical protein
MDIETLWGLQGSLTRRPRWSPPPQKPKEELTQRLAITGTEKSSNDDDELSSHSSWPRLQSISGSSDSEGDEDGFESEEEDEDGSDYETEDEDDEEYDSEDEEMLRGLERQAMAYATQTPSIFEGKHTEELEDVPDDKKDNPFIKLLGKLRGMALACDTAS